MHNSQRHSFLRMRQGKSVNSLAPCTKHWLGAHDVTCSALIRGASSPSGILSTSSKDFNPALSKTSRSSDKVSKVFFQRVCLLTDLARRRDIITLARCIAVTPLPIPYPLAIFLGERVRRAGSVDSELASLQLLLLLLLLALFSVKSLLNK